VTPFASQGEWRYAHSGSICTMAAMMKETICLLAWLCIAACGAAHAQDKKVILGTSTSLQSSGLLDALKPAFERDTGYTLQAHTTGSGKAIQFAREGAVDVLLVHAPTAEKEFIAQGYVAQRFPYMRNFFLIVGPASDPAGVKGLADARAAFARIARARSLFISRGDDSGNHQQETEIWKAAGVETAGSWYYEAGAGMAAVLKLANERGAYILIDDGTWLAQRKSSPLQVLVRDTERLGNTYALMTMSKAKLPQINHRGAAALAQWLTSARGKAVVSGLKVDGEPLYTLVSP
jgi:tungstate transport system substrate-binding protein